MSIVTSKSSRVKGDTLDAKFKEEHKLNVWIERRERLWIASHKRRAPEPLVFLIKLRSLSRN